MPAVLEHGADRVGGIVLRRQAQGGVVESSLDLPVGSIILCELFPSVQQKAALVLEAIVMSPLQPSSTDTESRSYVLRWNWAHCPGGADLLAERLSELLGVVGRDQQHGRVYRLPSGTLFSFPRWHEDGGAETPFERFGGAASSDGEPLANIRAHERVKFDVPCRFRIGSREEHGRIQNLAREGIFVTTDAETPPEGARVSVTVDLKRERQTHRVIVDGWVRWRIQGPGARPKGGGFGLQVRGIEDGRRGRVFHDFLDELLRERHKDGRRGASSVTGTSRGASTSPTSTGASTSRSSTPRPSQRSSSERAALSPKPAPSKSTRTRSSADSSVDLDLSAATDAFLGSLKRR